MANGEGMPVAGTEPRWRVALCFALLVVGLVVIAGPLLGISDWRVSPTNHGWLEAVSWWNGRLDIPATTHDPEHFRLRDSAWVGGKIYNVFPPLFSFLSYGAIGLRSLQFDGPRDTFVPDEFYAAWYVALVLMPLPLVGFWAFRAACGRSEWAAVLTAFWILGTPLFGAVHSCRLGEVNSINHVLSNVGLMLIAGDLLGRRRIWPAAIGLVIGLWTRQLTFLYVAAIAWAAWPATGGRSRKLAVVFAAVIVGLGATMALNQAKFGNPLDSGYGDIYTGRPDEYARRYNQYHRLFDIRFMPRNLYYMNLGLPDVREARGQLILNSHPDGVSIWLTSPLLLFGLLTCGQWWREPARRALMFCSFAVIVGFLCYHTTGSVQRGIFRFALDFVPIWLAVIAPFVIEGKRRWWTVGLMGWSVLYFHLLYSNPP